MLTRVSNGEKGVEGPKWFLPKAPPSNPNYPHRSSHNRLHAPSLIMSARETRSQRSARSFIASLNPGLVEEILRLACGLPKYQASYPPDPPPAPAFDMLAIEDWESRRAIHRENVKDGVGLLWELAPVCKEWRRIASSVSSDYTRLSADSRTPYMREEPATALMNRCTFARGLVVEAHQPGADFYHLLARVLQSTEYLSTLDITFHRRYKVDLDDVDSAFYVSVVLLHVGRSCPLRKLVWDFPTADVTTSLRSGNFTHLCILDVVCAVELSFFDIPEGPLTLPNLHTLRVNQRARTENNVLLVFMGANLPRLLSLSLRSWRWEVMLAIMLDRFEGTLRHILIDVPYRIWRPLAGQTILSMGTLERAHMPAHVARHRLGREYTSLRSLCLTDLSFEDMFMGVKRRRALKALKDFCASLDASNKRGFPLLGEIRLIGSSVQTFRHVKWTEEEKKNLIFTRSPSDIVRESPSGNLKRNTGWVLNMPTLINLPPDILHAIIEIALFEHSGSFGEHIQTCKSLRCHRVDHCLRNLRTLNSVSSSFRARLLELRLAYACIRIGRRSRLLVDDTPLEVLTNIAHTMAVEIDVGYLTHEVLDVLKRVLEAGKNTRRLSIDGCIPLGEDDDQYELALEAILTPVLTSSNHTRLVSVLLHLPVAGLWLVEPGHQRIRSTYFTTLCDEKPPRALSPHVWPMLGTLCIYFGSNEVESNTVLEGLTLSTFVSLETLWISYSERLDISMLRDLLENTKGTVLHLTVLVRSQFSEIVQIPASATLRSIECYFPSALALIRNDHSGLQELAFRGLAFDYGPEPEHTPGLEKARHVDFVIWELWQSGRLNTLQKLQLQFPLQTLFSSAPLDIFEGAIYAYWWALLNSLGIKLVDSDELDILPNAWALGLERVAPVYPF
ncbi:hypothetical protein SCHPADRAFT_886209 [Schizopora paradoxa]|uniref:Uncharacterized protein n=1 Tax=Schizopora paradoxa TaxID=27342 RepID=A0A0H2SN61_9AGAM|nr:hypothetical protein SCHPADRAFT_886209 [Schizopora paradoxa]